MKHVTASDARKNWFRLLDEAAAGEVIVIRRKGKRLVLRQEKLDPEASKNVPDYPRMIRVFHPEEADRWRWAWSSDEGLVLEDEEE